MFDLPKVTNKKVRYWKIYCLSDGQSQKYLKV